MKERSTGNTVLVVDAGGRGAALAHKYAQSERVGKIIGVPGNDLWKINTDKPVRLHPDLTTTSVKEIEEICKREKVGLVDVAQERAVEAGLVDRLKAKGIPVVGPTREAGRIEWDKAYARALGLNLQLPQPNFDIYTMEQLDAALTLMDLEPNKKRFIKAAFLADGKGAKPAKNREEAKERILEIVKTEAGKVFLIEDWLEGYDGNEGKEFSLFVISDGNHYRVLGNAQDYRRENNFDQGENTGSMGCNSPTLLMTKELLKDSKKEIIERILSGLRERGKPYKGVLYLGGMVVIEKEGRLKIYVIEWNTRWGDPEAQAILPGLKVDLFELGKAVSDGDLGKIKIGHDGKVRIVVTGAAKGYPRESEYKWVKGRQIFGLDKARKLDGITVYGAAVKEIDGNYYAWGGRLFYIVAEGKDIVEAKSKAAEAMSLVFIAGNNLKARDDVGWQDVQRFYCPPQKQISIAESIEKIEEELRVRDRMIRGIIESEKTGH